MNDRFNAKIERDFPQNWRDKRARFGSYFGELYVKNCGLQSGRKLLILNCAVGGTGFSDKRWGMKDPLYLAMMAKISLLLQNPANTFKAFLWHQGETDAQKNMPIDEYQSCLDKLVAGVRAEIGCVPFICGDLVPIWKIKVPYAEKIAEAQRQLVEKIQPAGFVESTGLDSNKRPDIIHFNRASQAELGKRYFEIYQQLIK